MLADRVVQQAVAAAAEQSAAQELLCSCCGTAAAPLLRVQLDDHSVGATFFDGGRVARVTPGSVASQHGLSTAFELVAVGATVITPSTRKAQIERLLRSGSSEVATFRLRKTVGGSDQEDERGVGGAQLLSPIARDLGVMRSDPRALFESLDADCNGRLDETEVTELLRMLGKTIDRPTLTLAMSEMDTGE